MILLQLKNNDIFEVILNTVVSPCLRSQGISTSVTSRSLPNSIIRQHPLDFTASKYLKHDLFRELIIYSACQMNESSYTSTLLYTILEAAVSSDVESEQMHITYISTAILFVTGLTNNSLKKDLIFSRLSSLSLSTAVNIYLPLTSRFHYGHDKHNDEAIYKFRRDALQLFLLPRLKHTSYLKIKKVKVVIILEEILSMQSFIQEKEESFLVNESNKIQYIFNLNDVNEIINALGTSFSREIQNGIDCDLLEEIISCLRHILCLVVKDLNQNLIKYCQEYANDSSNAAYILTDIEWIFETIRLIMGPVGVEFLTLHKKIDKHINRKGKPISDVQSTIVTDFKNGLI